MNDEVACYGLAGSKWFFRIQDYEKLNKVESNLSAQHQKETFSNNFSLAENSIGIMIFGFVCKTW